MTITMFRQELDGWRLSRYGRPVRWSSQCLSLAGPAGLWLVAEGELDLFAYGHRRWHPLGRLGPGALVPASVPGPTYVLVARPLAGCVVRRLVWGAPGSVAPSGEDLDAFARGVDSGLGPLLSAVAGAPVAGTPTLLPGYQVELRPGDAARLVKPNSQSAPPR